MNVTTYNENGKTKAVKINLTFFIYQVQRLMQFIFITPLIPDHSSFLFFKRKKI